MATDLQPETELQESPLTALTVSGQIDSMPVLFSVSDAKIAEIRAKYAFLDADTSDDCYEECRKAIATTRTLRVEIEKQREQLKRPALDYGRRVDAEAKRLTLALKEIEQPLQASKDKVDEERARAKREAEQAERARIEAEQQKQRDAERARLRVEQEAAEARLKAEREQFEAEQARALAEQERIEAQQREERERIERIEALHRQEREQIEAEKRRLEEDRRRLEQAEADRQAAIRAEAEARERAERERQEAIERAERERVEAERRAKEAADRAKAEAERLEALKPDIELIRELASQLKVLRMPSVTTTEGQRFVASVRDRLWEMGKECQAFKG